MTTENILPKSRIAPNGLSKLFAFFLLLLVLPPVLAVGQQTATSDVAAGAAQSAGEGGGGSLDATIADARLKVAADPASEEALTALGYLLLDKGDNEEAAKNFEAALVVNERYHEALTGKGIALARRGEDQAAEEILLKALVLNPNPVRTHYELGMLYEKRSEFDKAVDEYKKGIDKFKQGRK